MTCTCSIHSAFRFREYPQPSIFAGDSRFTPNSKGKTQSQTTSEAVERITKEKGVSPGTIRGLSDKSSRHIEHAGHERRRRAKA